MIAAQGVARVAIVGVLLLGLAHLTVSPVIYRVWSIDALWFIGTGLSFVIAATLNVVTLFAPDRLARRLACSIDLVMVGFLVAAWLVLPSLQVAAGIALFAVLSAAMWRVPPRRDASQ